MRVSVEWLYGDVVRYWSALDMTRQLKIQQTPVAQIYIVAVLLTNCITILRRSNTTSQYFQVEPPSIEEYFDIDEDSC
jgi:nuclease HARBI1